MSYQSAALKKNLELVLMFPFVSLGRLAGWLYPLKTDHTVFLFSSSADIGGSIRVNADLAECLKQYKPLVIFSKKPKNNQFVEQFNIEGVRTIDLHRYIDNKWYHFINFFFRGVIASWINRAKNPVVIGGESIYFFKVIPHIKNQARVIEICHLDTWLNYSIAFLKYIDDRIFSTPGIKREAEITYKENKVPGVFNTKLHFIDNKVDIPIRVETNNKALEILYVGRGAPQKRVHLVAEIARRMHDAGLPTHFSFVGDVDRIIPDEVKAYSTLHGQVNEKEKLDQIYQAADVLILTSAYEGLPLVVMEMMARGKLIVSTAVGGIPDYITDNENGLLLFEQEEDAIVEEAVSKIKRLIADPSIREKMGEQNYQYAKRHFSGESFCSAYNEILSRK